MGILDFFKLNKREDDSKLIELQNILFNINSNKLKVSKKQLNDISNKNLEKITQTICSISSAALEMFRSKKPGHNWYEWKTYKDKKVRSSHAYLDDVLINYDTPPSPEELIGEESIGKFNAGECFECRCCTAPVVRLDFISWPHKVFYNNRIITMTKEEFKSIM